MPGIIRSFSMYRHFGTFQQFTNQNTITSLFIQYCTVELYMYYLLRNHKDVIRQKKRWKRSKKNKRRLLPLYHKGLLRELDLWFTSAFIRNWLFDTLTAQLLYPFRSLSIPIKYLFISLQAFPILPLPIVGSKTTSSSLL